jgi:hypothetical protein
MRPATAVDVRVTADRLHLVLDDGREISAPLTDFPRLHDATPTERSHWEITDFGLAVRWPDIDEDIGLAGLLGSRSPSWNKPRASRSTTRRRPRTDQEVTPRAADAARDPSGQARRNRRTSTAPQAAESAMPMSVAAAVVATPSAQNVQSTQVEGMTPNARPSGGATNQEANGR